jgi:membrane fusion protein, multidrug efflux system
MLERHKVKLKIVGLLLLVLTFACNRNNESLETQISVPVSVEEISYQSIEEFITTTGTVTAVENVVLKAETDGFYRLSTNAAGKKYTLGSKVKMGETIIYLDNPELENNIKIESQKLNLDISKREFEKQQSLYEKGGVTLRELKNSEQAYIDAQYNFDNANIQLAKTKVIAPFDAVVVDLPYFTERTKMSVGAEMVELMNYAKLRTEINLPSKEINRIRVGQNVRVMNYTVPDDTLWGNITQVSPAIDPDTRSFKTSLEVNNKNLILRPGMFAKIEVVVNKKDSAIVVPKSVILASGRGKRVFVVERGSADERRIETGIENPEAVEVVRGLEIDERLIVKGFETLRDRTRVKVVR